MPRMNGIQAVEKVRALIMNMRRTNASVRIQEPKFVFMTAYMSMALKQHLKKLKVEHVYEKPLQQNSLREILFNESSSLNMNDIDFKMSDSKESSQE